MTNSETRTLVVTSSYDATTDVLLRHPTIPIDRIFRFNYDLIDQYTITVTPLSFEIRDPLGRVASLSSVYKCYLRKFERKATDDPQEQYADAELWYLLRAIIHQLWSLGRVVLVEPGVETSRLDKLTQLRIAERYFKVPDWEFIFRNRSSFSSNAVVKSLARGKLGEKVLNANRVQPTELDIRWPWFQQDVVHADYDVTVVFVRGKQFAFKLNRREIVENGRIDWKSDRAVRGLQTWELFELSVDFALPISSMMRDMKLDFGRLDFLLQEDGTLFFLEVNPNGQFAWLDLEDSLGVISAVCSEISPVTPIHPLQYSPF